MRKRKKRVWMIIFPFEYPALQTYLNEMSQKGWKLKKHMGIVPAGSPLKPMILKGSIIW